MRVVVAPALAAVFPVAAVAEGEDAGRRTEAREHDSPGDPAKSDAAR